MQIRELRLEDYDGIASLRNRHNMAFVSYERWSHNWLANPFRQEFHDVPMGLILENNQGEIVGALDIFHHMYEWNGRRLRAGAGSSWAVDVEHRSHSLEMIARFFAARNLDLLTNTTASSLAVKIWLAFRAKPIPVAGEHYFRWVTDYSRVVGSRLRRRNVLGAGMLKYPAAAAAWCIDLLRRRNRLGRPSDKVCILKGFDDRFDDLWESLRRRKDRLLGVRSQAALAWRFKYLLQEESAIILALEDGHGITGYTVLRHRGHEDPSIRQFLVVDLQARDESPRVVQALMRTALHVAKQRDVQMVTVPGFSPGKRSALLSLRPYRMTFDQWQWFFKASDDALHQALGTPDAWDLSMLDGDSIR